MAARPRRINEPALPTREEVQSEEVEDFGTSESLVKMLTESGATADGTTVHVYIIEPDSGEEPKIWKGSTDDYDLDALARKFGSGQYRVKAYGPNPTTGGRYSLILNQKITYRLSAEEDARLRALRDGKPVPGEAAALTPAAIAEAMKLAFPHLSVPQAQPQNQLGLIREVADIVRTMLPAHQVAQPAPMVDPLSMVRALAGAMRDLQPAERDPIEGGANAGPLDVVLRLVDKFAPLYADAIKAQQGAGAVPGAPAMLAGPIAVPQPGAVSAAQPSQPAQSSQPGENDVLLRLKMGLSFLVEQAKADNDPATYAAVIVDNVPPEELAAMLAAPDWIERLSAFEPAVKNHREWFEELKTEVQAESDERKKPPAGGDAA